MSIASDQAGPRLLSESTLRQRDWSRSEAVVCAIVLVTFGLRFYLPYRVPLGCALMLATLPAWFRVLTLYRHAVTLTVTTICALTFGASLTIYALASRYVAPYSLATDLGLLVFTFGGVGVVLWARQTLGDRATAFIYGVGLVLGCAVHGSSGNLNDWKGSWAIPVTVLLLAIADRRRWLSILCSAVLVLLSVMFDTRALAGVLLVGVVLLVWQMRPLAPSARVSYIWTGSTLVGLALATYYAGTAALVRGYLGVGAQIRSVAQIKAAGSLILGGRPEAAATAALMRDRFLGYGLGVMPRNSDVLLAKAGMARINYDPNNGYVDRYMFGGGFELHSVIGDIWVRLGVAGLVLVAVVLALFVSRVAEGLVGRTASGLLLFLVFWSGWNLLFSPLLSSSLVLTLALGMALSPKQRAGSEEPSDSGHRGADR